MFSYGETNTPRHLFSLRDDDDDFAILRFSSGGDSSRDSSEFPAAAAAPDRPTGSESLIFFCVLFLAAVVLTFRPVCFSFPEVPLSV